MNAGGPPGYIMVVPCDDYDHFCHGLAEMLTTADDIEVVGEADTHEGAIAVVFEKKPDVVLLDLEMPGGGSRRRCERYYGFRGRRRSSSLP